MIGKLSTKVAQKTIWKLCFTPLVRSEVAIKQMLAPRKHKFKADQIPCASLYGNDINGMNRMVHGGVYRYGNNS